MEVIKRESPKVLNGNPFVIVNVQYIFLKLLLVLLLLLKITLEWPRRRCEGNIRMNLKDMVSIRGIGLIRLRIKIIREPL